MAVRRGFRLGPGWVGLGVMVLALGAACARPAGEAREAAPDEEAYRAATEEWRAAREASLAAEDGWLSVAGFFVLDEGRAERMGSCDDCDIRLPADQAPPLVGTVELSRGRVYVTLALGAYPMLNGDPAPEAFELQLRRTSPWRPGDRLEIGRLTIVTHRSGARTGLRVRDPEGPVMLAFTGLRWFPIDPRYRVSGRFIPYREPREVSTINVLGDEIALESPGEAELSIDGRTVRLQAWQEGDQLWFVFRDRSAGVETYGIRQVYADPPEDGQVTLDFNRSTNTPCAYNPYTTCPNPPPENVLADVEILAGERLYDGPSPLSFERW